MKGQILMLSFYWCLWDTGRVLMSVLWCGILDSLQRSEEGCRLSYTLAEWATPSLFPHSSNQGSFFHDPFLFSSFFSFLVFLCSHHIFLYPSTSRPAPHLPHVHYLMCNYYCKRWKMKGRMRHVQVCVCVGLSFSLFPSLDQLQTHTCSLPPMCYYVNATHKLSTSDISLLKKIIKWFPFIT